MGLLGCRWVHLTGASQPLDGGGDKQNLAGIGREGIGHHRLISLLLIDK